jgi:hypothetical protein
MNDDHLFSETSLSELKATILRHAAAVSESDKWHKQLYFIQQNKNSTRKENFEYLIRFNSQHDLCRQQNNIQALILPSILIEIVKELLFKKLGTVFTIKAISSLKVIRTLNPILHDEIFFNFKKSSKKEIPAAQIYEIKIYDKSKDFLYMNMEI